MDVYDEAVDYLTKNPTEIERAWMHNSSIKGGCLFMFMSGDRMGGMNHDARIGCPTMVKRDVTRVTGDAELTKLIKENPDMPDRSDFITVESLPLFAEYQRMADRKMNRPDIRWDEKNKRYMD